MDEEGEGPVCPSCGTMVPLERFDLHLEGLDGAHPECPRTDLVEVAEQARRESQQREQHRLWAMFAHPFSRAGF